MIPITVIWISGLINLPNRCSCKIDVLITSIDFRKNVKENGDYSGRQMLFFKTFGEFSQTR